MIKSERRKKIYKKSKTGKNIQKQKKKRKKKKYTEQSIGELLNAIHNYHLGPQNIDLY